MPLPGVQCEVNVGAPLNPPLRAEAVAVEERAALVSSTLACAASGSFYDGTGAIDGRRGRGRPEARLMP